MIFFHFQQGNSLSTNNSSLTIILIIHKQNNLKQYYFILNINLQIIIGNIILIIFQDI